MKTKVQYLLAGSVLALSVFGLSLSSDAANMPATSKTEAINDVMVGKCMSCHSEGYDLPFYASIPGIKGIIEKDFNDGIRAMDISAEFKIANADVPFNEAALAKMEWAILNNTMPPMKFAMVHWGSTLSDREKKDILKWVKDVREEHYATGTSSKKLANEPLQPIPVVAYDKEKAELGQLLFDDKRLSTDSTLACSGCHGMDMGGTDQQQFSEGVRKQFGDINAPTTFNAVFNVEQFWDGRAADLQAQAAGPPLNPIEMGSVDWNEIIARLSQDAELTAAFVQIYPSGWSADNITHAIAEFEKTLVTPNSRFDQWLMGSKNALTEEEIEGYRLFKLYRCSSCHVGKSAGGQSYEYMDLKGDYFATEGRTPLNSDKGRMNFTQNPKDLHKFKVPTLRNVEYTWPYMHDGTVTSLDESVKIMGDYLSGISVPEKDRKLIVAFLRSLTGELGGKPLEGKVVPN